MSDQLIVAILSFLGTVIGALIGAFATIRVAQANSRHLLSDTPTSPTGVVEPWRAMTKVPAPSKRPSYWATIVFHLFFGCGLFYLRASGWRQWIYPLFPIYAVLDFILGPILRIDPFRTNDFGATTFGISLGLFAITFLDVIFTCRLRRKYFDKTCRSPA